METMSECCRLIVQEVVSMTKALETEESLLACSLLNPFNPKPSHDLSSFHRSVFTTIPFDALLAFRAEDTPGFTDRLQVGQVLRTNQTPRVMGVWSVCDRTRRSVQRPVVGLLRVSFNPHALSPDKQSK